MAGSIYDRKEMSAVEGKKIAIVGGWPGGLTLARLLQQSGAQVAVYERDQSRSARVQGSALDLHEDSGLAALAAAGLMDAFWANHRPDLDRLRLTDAHGKVLHYHVTLIGDAAHVMPPYAGEGVNMAMLDALILSKLLLQEKSASGAIAIYETEMFARMQHITADTMANTEMFYAPDASDRVVALFRSFSGEKAIPPASEA